MPFSMPRFGRSRPANNGFRPQGPPQGFPQGFPPNMQVPPAYMPGGPSPEDIEMMRQMFMRQQQQQQQQGGRQARQPEMEVEEMDEESPQSPPRTFRPQQQQGQDGSVDLEKAEEAPVKAGHRRWHPAMTYSLIGLLFVIAGIVMIYFVSYTFCSIYTWSSTANKVYCSSERQTCKVQPVPAETTIKASPNPSAGRADWALVVFTHTGIACIILPRLCFVLYYTLYCIILYIVTRADQISRIQQIQLTSGGRPRSPDCIRPPFPLYNYD